MRDARWVGTEEGVQGGIRILGKVQAVFQHLSSAFSHPCASHCWDAGGSRFVPWTGTTWDRAVLLQLDSPCHSNALTRKLSLIKFQGLRWGLLLPTLDFTPSFKLGEFQVSESSDMWIYYLHCSMRLLQYPLSHSERCLVYSGVLRYVHFQSLFIHHPSPSFSTHTLSSFHKQRAFLSRLSSQKCFPLTPDQLLWASLAHLG